MKVARLRRIIRMKKVKRPRMSRKKTVTTIDDLKPNR